MSKADNLPEKARAFVYDGGYTMIGEQILSVCLMPAMSQIGVTLRGSGTDSALGFGLGGEIVRYGYYQGTQQILGEPPLGFDQAREICMTYSSYSSLIPDREHISYAILGALSCAYEKGFVRAFGEV